MIAPGDKELGLGVVNPRLAEIESPQRIGERIRAALRWVPPERLFINPDCGFGTFAARPMNSLENAKRKIEAMVVGARQVREQLVGSR